MKIAESTEAYYEGNDIESRVRGEPLESVRQHVLRSLSNDVVHREDGARLEAFGQVRCVVRRLAPYPKRGLQQLS
jgi:hypothetical protein